MKKIDLSKVIFLFLIVFTNPIISGLEISNLTICNQNVKNLTEENDDLYSLYNNCSLDYHRGENCPIIVSLLKDNNEKLSGNLHACLESKGRFQTGFFVALGILFVIGALIINWAKKR